MALVVSGLLNKQIGAELGISEITVKAHRGQVLQKMKANSLVDLARMALEPHNPRVGLLPGSAQCIHRKLVKCRRPPLGRILPSFTAALL